MKLVAIDDDPAILMLLEMALKADGHEVMTVLVKDQSVNELVGSLGEQQPDGIILDYRLPNNDSMVLKRKLCQAFKIHPNSIIFLTASPESLSSEHPCIAKPFSPLQISALVCDMVSNSANRTKKYDG